MALIVGLSVFIVFLFMGIPVFFILAATTIIYFLMSDIAILTILQRMFVGLDQFAIMAVPMFILTGNLMSKGGVLKRIIGFSKALVGHLRGGLAHVNVVASMFFAGITGAATADVSALGPMEIEMMEKGGYSKEFSTAVTISSSIIGPIIPPSLPLVIYGVVSSTSIGALFMAGILPGIFMGISLMVVIYFMTFKLNVEPQKRASFNELWHSFINSLGALALPLIILIGIYSGIFTPTEAAAIAALYAFIMGMFVYKELTWKDMLPIFLKSAIITAASLSILAISNVLSFIFSIELVAVKLSTFLLSLTENKFVLIILINLGMLALGCVMETLAAIIITAPIFLPMLVELGMSPVQFGVIISINLTLGLLTPPVGMNLFIASSITGLKFEKIAKSTFPFLIVLFFCVIVVSFFPGLSLALPRLMGFNV